jgi:hypothetical protein
MEVKYIGKVRYVCDNLNRIFLKCNVRKCPYPADDPRFSNRIFCPSKPLKDVCYIDKKEEKRL